VGGRTVKTRTTRAGRVSSYEEVRLWLAAELGIQVKYDVVHNLVHEKLTRKSLETKSSEGRVENFKKELAQKLTSVFKEVKAIKKFKRVRYWCEDETGWD